MSDENDLNKNDGMYDCDGCGERKPCTLGDTHLGDVIACDDCWNMDNKY